jgi:hypothetical protein
MLKKTGIRTFDKENMGLISFVKKPKTGQKAEDWKEPQSM